MAKARQIVAPPGTPAGARMAGTELRLVGLAGWSGAGKTSLLARVIPCLIGQGVSVSTLKHAITPSTWTSRARIPGSTARPAPGRSWWPRRSAGR
jgi:putative protein kinase ArgK-like GTPase of G3E family